MQFLELCPYDAPNTPPLDAQIADLLRTLPKTPTQPTTPPTLAPKPPAHSSLQPTVLRILAEQLTSAGETLVVGTARTDARSGDDDAAVFALCAQLRKLGGGRVKDDCDTYLPMPLVGVVGMAGPGRGGVERPVRPSVCLFVCGPGVGGSI